MYVKKNLNVQMGVAALFSCCISRCESCLTGIFGDFHEKRVRLQISALSVTSIRELKNVILTYRASIEYQSQGSKLVGL